MAVFGDSKAKNSDYRKFKIRASLNEVGKLDDFASMREVIYRRFSKIALTSPLPAADSSQAGLTPLLKGEEEISTSPLPAADSSLAGLTPLLKGEGNKVSNPSLSSQEREPEGEVIDISFSKMPDLVVIDGGKGQ